MVPIWKYSHANVETDGLQLAMRWIVLEDNKIVQINGEKFNSSVDDETEAGDLLPDEVLKQAGEVEWDHCLVLGFTKNGGLQVLSSSDDFSQANLIIDIAKQKLIEAMNF